MVAPSPDGDSATPTTSENLKIIGKITVPDGEPGKLSIVTIGQPAEGGSVPVIVRNRTSKTLVSLEVTGTARAAGKLIGSGSSQGFAPENLKPGEWAIGYVYFSSGRMSPKTQFDLTANAKEPDSTDTFYAPVDLKVQEMEISKSQFGKQIVGILLNPTDAVVEGPVSVNSGCFTKGKLTQSRMSFAEGDKVQAKGTTSFNIDLFDAVCDAVVVGASGHTS